MVNLLDIKPNVVTRGVGDKHFLFYGEPSTRKTSVAALFPDSLIIATEIGYKQIPNVKAIDVDSWATFLQILYELEKEEVKKTYKTIVIDTVGILSDLCVQYICSVNGVKSLDEMGYGKGWTAYKTHFTRAINKIAQLGYSIVFIAHAETKVDKDGNIVSVEPRIDRRPKEAIIALSDYILFLKKEMIGDKETVIAYSQLPEGIITKTRTRGLAPSFEFTFENLNSELEKALSNYNEHYGEIEIVDSTRKEVQEVPFETIKEEAVKTATYYSSHEVYKDAATELIVNTMKGVPISQAPSSYRDILINLTQALKDLEN